MHVECCCHPADSDKEDEEEAEENKENDRDSGMSSCGFCGCFICISACVYLPYLLESNAQSNLMRTPTLKDMKKINLLVVVMLH